MSAADDIFNYFAGATGHSYFDTKNYILSLVKKYKKSSTDEVEKGSNIFFQ